jgi:hypothetical protein
VLFIYLLKIPNKGRIYYEPWKFIFFALIIFIIEEVMTILEASGAITFPRILFAFFEMAIITLFVYSCLIQKESIKNARN